MDSAVQPLWTASKAAAALELVVDGGARGHVGLLPEVELAVAEPLLAVDERRQGERLLPVAQQRRRQRVAHGLGDVVAHKLRSDPPGMNSNTSIRCLPSLQ
jgi:hypothetical protein